LSSYQFKLTALQKRCYNITTTATALQFYNQQIIYGL